MKLKTEGRVNMGEAERVFDQTIQPIRFSKRFKYTSEYYICSLEILFLFSSKGHVIKCTFIKVHFVK